jgi:hypothetical protein
MTLHITVSRPAITSIRSHSYRSVWRIALLAYAAYLWLLVACVRLLTSKTELPALTSPTRLTEPPMPTLEAVNRRTRLALPTRPTQRSEAAGFAPQGGASRRSTKATSSPQLTRCGVCGVERLAAKPLLRGVRARGGSGGRAPARDTHHGVR